ncbi:DUF3443 family protein [Paraburkholderia mimosarum]|uniref:DUF3443 family protein n=1 Tax=Paraburkholderia mimosarum TaxID=312026 RepID=UPI00040975B4|nr:DUF3443 family protein [Paraburkholderia mimosarum]
MSSMRNTLWAMALCLLLAACGGGGGSSNGGQTAQSSTPGSSGSGNVLAIHVDTSLAPTGAGYAPNVPVTTVTVCVHGTNQCVTVDDVLVDTGSVGLRLAASALGSLTTSLPTQTDSSGNAIGECYAFADGRYFWGPVVSADIKLAGEVASDVPMQIDGATSGFPSTPSGCATGYTLADAPSLIGANGILGVGSLVQDCPGCTTNATNDIYFSCNTSTGICHSTTQSAANQVQNPVAAFAVDNNGVIVKLPAISATGQASVDGSLVFGIGTQSDNTFAATSVLGYDPALTFTTQYSGKSMTESYIDSGSNGLFFVDSSIVPCSGTAGWYCPAATLALSATSTGNAGPATPANMSFMVANENNLARTRASAFDNLAATGLNNTFDWGLPFFFGRNVYFAIAGRTAPGGTAPYVAF